MRAAFCILSVVVVRWSVVCVNFSFMVVCFPPRSRRLFLAAGALDRPLLDIGFLMRGREFHVPRVFWSPGPMWLGRLTVVDFQMYTVEAWWVFLAIRCGPSEGWKVSAGADTSLRGVLHLWGVQDSVSIEKNALSALGGRRYLVSSWPDIRKAISFPENGRWGSSTVSPARCRRGATWGAVANSWTQRGPRLRPG